MIGALLLIKKGLEKYIQQIPGNIKNMTTKDHTTWNISHPNKGTLHQIDSVLPHSNPGPRNGSGYHVVCAFDHMRVCAVISILQLLLVVVICEFVRYKYYN